MLELMTGAESDDEFAARDSAETVRVMDALSNRPRELGRIAAHAGLSELHTLSVLGTLQSEGRVNRSDSGWNRV